MLTSLRSKALDIVDTEYSNEVDQSKLIRISTIDLDKIAFVTPEMRGQSLLNFPENHRDRFRHWDYNHNEILDLSL
jgi:hypothetical protein